MTSGISSHRENAEEGLDSQATAGIALRLNQEPQHASSDVLGSLQARERTRGPEP